MKRMSRRNRTRYIAYLRRAADSAQERGDSTEAAELRAKADAIEARA